MQCPDAVLQALFGTPMDRRRFLKGSATGAALLGVGALLPTGCSRYPKPQASLRFFNPREYAIVNAAAERLLGLTGMVGAGPECVDVAANVDALIVAWDREAQGQLRIMLRLFEHGTYVFDLRRQRFTHLSPEYQDRYLAGWMNSTLGARRMVFRALKALVAAGFYQDARGWPRLGYEGPWRGRIDATARLQPERAVPLSAVRPTGA